MTKPSASFARSCRLGRRQLLPLDIILLQRRRRHLSGECVTCHPRDTRNVGIPVINGWPADQFVAVLKSYKARERDNPVMQSIAAGLNDEEMAALAAYFETLK